jgi:hypothetical protein
MTQQARAALVRDRLPDLISEKVVSHSHAGLKPRDLGWIAEHVHPGLYRDLFQSQEARRLTRILRGLED